MFFLKDPFASASHAVGIVLSMVALVVLLMRSKGCRTRKVSFTIYGLSLILLYTCSTLYHSLNLSPTGVLWLQRLDFCAIFLLIAGSYTPVCLITLRGRWGKFLLCSVWTMGMLGIAGTLFWWDAPAWIRVVLYVAMGWMAMLGFSPLRQGLSTPGLCWLVGGGIVYSIGTVIFVLDQPYLWHGKFTAHDLWHVFVLAGSACHFVVMSRFVAPERTPSVAAPLSTTPPLASEV
jgi:hemolysin III